MSNEGEEPQPSSSSESQPIVADPSQQSTWPIYRMRETPQHLRDLYSSEQATPIVLKRKNGVLLYLWHRY
jgi:hypothetical protein